MDDETQRQLAELRDQVAATTRIRAAHRQRLSVLQEQAAKFGIEAPAHLVTEIADLGVTIRETDAQLVEFRRLIARLELAPQSALILPGGDAIYPELIPAVVDSRLQALDRSNERTLDGLDQIWGAIERAAIESREWRSAERAAREAGMRGHHEQHRTLRAILIGGAVVLLIVAIGVVVIAVRVF